MINIRNLAFSYKTNAVLKNISMDLKEGSIYGLLGENGVGKTTLLTLLCGLKKPQEGTITCDGYKPYDRDPEFLENLYYLPDECAPVTMTPAEYVKTYGKFWKTFDGEKFTNLLEIFEVEANHPMNKMSAGQLKKTYISFAIACQTKYLLMDEPTNGLDIPSKTQFRKAVTAFTREDSVLVISTHQVKDLENIIDPIIILDRQDVLVNASIEEIEQKLLFDYSSEIKPDSLYSEFIPGGCIQVRPNTTGESSKVNIEALFNTVHGHKQFIKEYFKK
ncbi:MAG: ATP-binding cassette domain-containing protein [Bacteroidales bacterium]|nr:ATP-binding cassette domain-containing protein [Bacteroidales bacterium]